MRISVLASAAAVGVLAVSATLLPSPAFAVASVSWSQNTICPGETAVLTINGVSDAVEVPMATNEHGMFNDQFSDLMAGPYTYAQAEQSMAFGVINVAIVYTTNPGVVPGTFLAGAILEVLPECLAPEPEPEVVPVTDSTGLPDTGIAPHVAGVAIGSAFLFAIAGFFIVRGRRQLHLVSVNQKISARMKRLEVMLSRMENDARRRRNRRR